MAEIDHSKICGHFFNTLAAVASSLAVVVFKVVIVARSLATVTHSLVVVIRKLAIVARSLAAVASSLSVILVFKYRQQLLQHQYDDDCKLLHGHDVLF